MHGSKLNQEALNTYCQSFASIILDDFFSKNQGINGQQIISVTPVKQVNFFVLKVLFEQWQEETKKFKSPLFNYKNQEVNTALKNLVNTLSKNILIEKDDFKPLLEEASRDALTLLYDPEGFYFGNVSKTKRKDFRGMGKYIKIYKDLFDQLALAIEHNTDQEQKAIMSPVLEGYEIDAQQQSEVIALFDSVLKIDFSDDAPQKKVEEVVEPPASPVEEKTPEESPENINGHDAPIEEEIKGEFKPLSAKKKADASLVHDQFAEEDIKTLNQKFEQKEVKETIATKHENAGSEQIAATISINQRYMFLSDLFEGSEPDYNTALENIEMQSTFDDAVEYLMQTFSKKYSWDMSSDEVKEFLKIIFKRFR